MDRAQDQKIDLWIIMSVAWNPEKIIELSLFLSTWNVLAPKKFLAKDDWKLLLLVSMLSICCRIREEDFIFKNKLTDIDSMPVSTSNWKNLSTNHKQAPTSKSMSVKTFTLEWTFRQNWNNWNFCKNSEIQNKEKY